MGIGEWKMNKYFYKESRERELDLVKNFYSKEINRIKVNTPDKATNLLLNSFFIKIILVHSVYKIS